MSGLTDITLADLRARRSAKWTAYPPDVLPAWVAEMDFPPAPAVTAALRDAVEAGDTGYASPDAAGYVDAFCGFAERRMDWRVDPAGVAPLRDVMGGVAELIRLLVPPGEGVVINPPVYRPFFSVVEEAGRRAVEVPLREGNALDLDATEAALAAGARAVLLCNPHNPTGAVPGREELGRLADLAATHEAWVISDEIHAPLVLPGATHVPFPTVSPAAADRGFALVSASKAFNIAGLKGALGVTADGAARERLHALPGVARHPGHLGVLASVAAFRDGDAWLDEVLGILDANRRSLEILLAEHLPGVAYEPPRAGYLAWLDCRALALGGDPAEAFLLRGKVALSDGPQFGAQGAGFARLNIGTTPALMAEAVRRMASAIS